MQDLEKPIQHQNDIQKTNTFFASARIWSHPSIPFSCSERYDAIMREMYKEKKRKRGNKNDKRRRRKRESMGRERLNQEQEMKKKKRQKNRNW